MLDKMIAAAAEVQKCAYAPYSSFGVGVCLLTPKNNLYVGTNVENAAYPQSQCAEASAIGAMIAGGEKEISEVVVFADGNRLCTPCGGCRQRLSEFASPKTPVHICGPDGLRKTFSLLDLLPFSFGPEHLSLP